MRIVLQIQRSLHLLRDLRLLLGGGLRSHFRPVMQVAENDQQHANKCKASGGKHHPALASTVCVGSFVLSMSDGQLIEAAHFDGIGVPRWREICRGSLCMAKV